MKLFRFRFPPVVTLTNKVENKVVHSQKRAASKSSITKPTSGCVRIAYTGLMIASLLHVVNRLAASCELHAGLMQVVSSTYSKPTNIMLQQV